MEVASWSLFPDELRAALITAYPSINWRVTVNRRTPNEVEGVNVDARRAGHEATIWIPVAVLRPMNLHELLTHIHDEAERRLVSQ